MKEFFFLLSLHVAVYEQKKSYNGRDEKKSFPLIKCQSWILYKNFWSTTNGSLFAFVSISV